MAFEIFNKKKSDSKNPARNVRKGSKEKEADKKKKKKDLELDLKKFSFAERWEDERFRSSIGIVTIGLSLFFFISIISSFFTGNNDILLVKYGMLKLKKIIVDQILPTGCSFPTSEVY